MGELTFSALGLAVLALANLLNYTRKSFDEFKSDIEQRSRSNSTPTSPNFSSSKP